MKGLSWEQIAKMREELRHPFYRNTAIGESILAGIVFDLADKVRDFYELGERRQEEKQEEKEVASSKLSRRDFVVLRDMVCILAEGDLSSEHQKKLASNLSHLLGSIVIARGDVAKDPA